MREFIRQHREDIDRFIKEICPKANVTNDDERHEWIINEGSLYMWARSEGVKV